MHHSFAFAALAALWLARATSWLLLRLFFALGHGPLQLLAERFIRCGGSGSRLHTAVELSRGLDISLSLEESLGAFPEKMFSHVHDSWLLSSLVSCSFS